MMRRIVSLNMCLDELALRLADRERVASVLWMSRDPLNSNVADLARTIPGNSGTAEEAVSFSPDLVLVGEFTSTLTKSMLRRVGMPVHLASEWIYRRPGIACGRDSCARGP